jgi:hypothetical protein
MEKRGPALARGYRTFRAKDPPFGPAANEAPAAFARTTFVGALRRAGVRVEAELVTPNPSNKLPPPNCYRANRKVADLVSAPYA